MLSNWEDVVDVNFPKIPEITREMAFCASTQCLSIVGCVRLAMGKISSTKSLNERKERALKEL